MPRKQSQNSIPKTSKSVPTRQDKNVHNFTDYNKTLCDLINCIETARHAAVYAVNAIMTAAYWKMGRRIVESEQKGKKRAGYGEALLNQLAIDLTAKLGRGFSRQNLQRMRQFYLQYPPALICSTLSGKLKQNEKRVSISLKKIDLESLACAFPLSWSHYVLLLTDTFLLTKSN